MNLFYQKIKDRPIFVYLLLLALAFWRYWPALGTWFVSDDFHWLYIARETPWSWQILASNYEGGSYGGSYNPLLVIIFKIFYAVFGQTHQLYHLLSIILHASSAYVLYLLARRILPSSLDSTAAALAAFLFLIWPSHVETLYWIAAWPHLWALLFYLLSLLFYFSFRQAGGKNKLLLSLLFFVFSLFTKEVAISLPLLILLWESYWFSINKAPTNLGSRLTGAYYLVLAALFACLRYLSIGLFWGYYSRHSLGVDIKLLAANLASYLSEYASASLLRTLFFKIHYHYLESVAIVILAALALIFYYFLKKRAWLSFAVFASWLLALAPVLSLGLHRTTFGGERYLYVATPFLTLWLTYLFFRWPVGQKIKIGLLLLFVVFAFAMVNYKAYLWQQGAALSRQIVASYQRIDTEGVEALVTVGLPDNLSGAEVFRNNLGQALALNYPDRALPILALPVYVQLNWENQNNSLLKWRSDNLGWFAESSDGSFVVTGITSIEAEGFYFELWNYNYQNYTANIIRLMPQSEIKEKIASGQIKIMTFDRGSLKLVE
ncbi:MAG: hypothetical protein PHO91_04215 [Patescibacteria group bacterium]|nr:hypothetical protein [Patescibacteria group bacterium]